MKKTNLNDYMYIQMDDSAIKHLVDTVGLEYVRSCIEPKYERIDGEEWCKLQIHQAFSLFPIEYGKTSLIGTDVIFI